MTIPKSLLTRTLSGLVFLLVMLAGLLVHPTGYLLLMFLCTGIMTAEYYRITLGPRFRIGQYTGLVTVLLIFAMAYLLARYRINPRWLFLLVFPVFLLFICLLFGKKEGENYGSGLYLFMPLLYIALPFSLFNILAFDAFGRFNAKMLLILFILLWASDVGAYLSGMAFGQKHGHRLCPRLSPKKSWEGFAGGLIMAVSAAVLMYFARFMNMEWFHCLAIALILNICSVFGDLAESQLKRHFGVKDSGSIMPGHGGLLDRFDGTLLAFPVVIAYLQILNLL